MTRSYIWKNKRPKIDWQSLDPRTVSRLYGKSLGTAYRWRRQDLAGQRIKLMSEGAIREGKIITRSLGQRTGVDEANRMIPTPGFMTSGVYTEPMIENDIMQVKASWLKKKGLRDDALISAIANSKDPFSSRTVVNVIVFARDRGLIGAFRMQGYPMEGSQRIFDAFSPGTEIGESPGFTDFVLAFHRSVHSEYGCEEPTVDDRNYTKDRTIGHIEIFFDFE